MTRALTTGPVAETEIGRGDRAATIARLRGKIAAVERSGPADRPPPVVAAPSAVEEATAEGLAGLARPGTVGVLDGSPTALLGLLARVTAAGGHAAIVGLPQLGLAAAAEMGAVLDRLVWIPDPGPDPLAVTAVLVDGMALVVLDPAGAALAPSRTRAITARVRRGPGALVVAGGDWPGADVRVEAAVTGGVGLGCGHGRIRGLDLAVRIRSRSGAPRGIGLALRHDGRRLTWSQGDTRQTEPAPASAPVRIGHGA